MIPPGRAARSVVVALCLAVGLAAWAAFFSPQAMAAEDDARAIVSVVSTFYTNYIAALRKSFAGEKPDYDFRRQPEADAAFVRKIDKLIKEAENSEAGLGYDPILMAQDVPTGMRYAKPAIKGGSAELIAYTLWDGGSKHALCVSLAKKGGVWRIVDVTDMEDAETRQECGGMKAGGKASKP